MIPRSFLSEISCEARAQVVRQGLRAFSSALRTSALGSQLLGNWGTSELAYGIEKLAKKGENINNASCLLLLRLANGKTLRVVGASHLERGTTEALDKLSRRH